MYTVYEVQTKKGSYVGVTSRLIKTRLSELRSRYGFDGAIRAIASYEDCARALALEFELRPTYGIGLNKGKGGHAYGAGTQRFGSANTIAKRVRIAGVEYPTMTDAGKALGVKLSTIHYRLGSPYFPDWEYVTPPHARYWQDDFARKRRIPAIAHAYHRRAM
jgi:hypothetical protein